ncbi:carbohydrate kinase (plasmid) [Hymenobacter sp. NBH84]|uniref:Carbohydrate kinase n=1 Tax=Hymenobacter citatus TaxID=2763506 RepID=A0ABR7MMU1_9BACT|nr:MULTISPECIES: carbohydrate kinase [Hymenobacter]MBC6612396.1 carbohydrate kinase [Hymenobacter citatus]QNE41983.1 carbohydrate kinase [Hymenobacter sp. NBH84]
MPTSVVCFGEVLWDILPTGQQPGGAPFNVAVHLSQLGQPAELISRVGDDELGRELLAFIESKHLSTTYVQQGHTHLTGVVKANVDDANEVVYKIVQPVAWDYIQYEAALADTVAEADMLVYGSLVARQTNSRETLYRLLESARFRVFDVNLRPPHYTREVTKYLLSKANLVKMNHHELTEVMEWLGQGPVQDREAAMQWLAQRYQLQAVCVTCGADGALLYTGGQLYRAPGLPVQVRDTIGSGDAFLAALLKGWLAGDKPDAMLRFACAAGALVATHQGATPAITAADVAKLLAPQTA